ncbi:2-phospho-L-lactate guanylyltransferase [Rhodococcus sp. NPDC079359]|jgi:2-phospho-L-lactate guanylyltransferase|uniref:Phosphoenolpyruvate guanylyltransferase n=2 Tax=Nocardiaceae TaxID=85025 RepID=A0ABU4ASF3_9NOCA|nr:MULTISPECIES: 2-phospho-L-lactate guanylyltransferase [Rhodococcus]MDV6229168.1 2-phospho-L-lactate guanylyltransferase [Rhodococcus cercidiphylli]MDV8055220.1 2-phospho-L-lactate guanylyltransferase [Rhodococcus sp. IEGM 1343]
MGASRDDDGDRVVRVLIAVKDLTAAKSRLAAEFSAPDRTRLVLAMLSDTVAAADAVSVVDSVTVVTPDPLVAETARRIGALVFDEPVRDPALQPDQRLNHAFAAAAHVLRHCEVGVDDRGDVRGGEAVARRVDIIALQADLPAMRSAELAQAYASARRGGRSLVIDHHGTGTAALILKDSPDELAPLFGRDSARRHTVSGALELDGTWPGLRLDVDTADDVRGAHRLGVGPATAAVLHSLGWSDEASATTA